MKERIPVLVCVSATGEKLKPLVIGRSTRPRWFHGLQISNLGDDYHYSGRIITDINGEKSIDLWTKGKA